MPGPLIIVFVVVIAIPVALLMTCAAITAIFGWVLKANGEANHEGSELIELNR